MSTILVVDDRPDARYALVRVADECEGSTCSETATGRDALRQQPESVPDLIVLDIALQDMDGFEVCRRLKADGVTSGSPWCTRPRYSPTPSIGSAGWRRVPTSI